jgi:hypothetical protein
MIERERRSIERRIKEARFPALKSLNAFDFIALPSLNKSLVLELAARNISRGAKKSSRSATAIQQHNAHLAMWPYLLGLVALLERFAGAFAAALRPQQRLLPFRSPVVRG